MAEEFIEQSFIFGYGSLISTEARTVTGQSEGVLPVRVRGLKRFWNGYPEICYSVLGVTPDAHSSCNGIIFRVPDNDLPQFDKREMLYRKILLKPGSIEYLGEQSPAGGEVWVYLPHRLFIPSESLPLLQSYIDVALSGCLEFSREFAVEFIRTTAGWDRPWLNDRAHEQYQRALRGSDHVEAVDELLAEHCGGGFSRRYP